MAKRMYGQLYKEGKQSRLAAAFLSGADDETKRLCRTFMAATSEIHLKAPANKSSVPSEPSCPVGSCNCGSHGSPVKLRWNLRACSGRPLSDVYSHGFNLHTFYMPQKKKNLNLGMYSRSVNDLPGGKCTHLRLQMMKSCSSNADSSSSCNPTYHLSRSCASCLSGLQCFSCNSLLDTSVANENAYRMDRMESQYSIKPIKYSVNPREGKMDSGRSVFRRWPNVQINRQI
ncbi:hypothetical protein V3C99_017490 [Haemonchus contortus]